MTTYFIFSLFIIFSFYNVYSYTDCSELGKTYENIKTIIDNAYSKYLYSSYNDENRTAYYEDYKALLERGVKMESSYNNCLVQRTKQINKASDLFDKGYESYNDGDYENSVDYYKQYLEVLGDTSDKNYKIAVGNIVLALKELASLNFNKENRDKAILNYKLALTYDNKDYEANYNLGAAYYNTKDYVNALKYYTYAYDYATTKSNIESSKEMIDKINIINDQKELTKNAPTNDPLSGYQYYLKQLNIPNAWKKVSKSNQVVVAVIDDGMNINHPDLLNSLWVNPNAKYGDSKIIDFVGDGLPANLPVGEHGTMVAGIIGATTNNKEGIAGIAKNVKIMPLRVFDTDGNAKKESIIKAMEYAIENGANIINLSLGGTQFSYTDSYDTVIKKAFEKGIVVVIAAGNGDVLSDKETGINLTNNPISPVCNNGGKYKYSIGVYATDEDGYRTNWTNYGNCTDFFAPGVDIISTSIPVFNSQYGSNYNMLNGTSFSAPIITGIIALGYNQFGYIDPIVVYDSLEESKVKDSKVGYKIDATKYLDILGKKININKQGDLIFSKLQKSYNKLSSIKKNKAYTNILNSLKKVSQKLGKSDKKSIIERVIFNIEKELSK